VIEESDSSILGILNDAASDAERNFANDMIIVHVSTVTVNRENVDASFQKGIFCVRVYLVQVKKMLLFDFYSQDVIASYMHVHVKYKPFLHCYF